MSLLSRLAGTMIERQTTDSWLPCRAAEAIRDGFDQLEERVTGYLASHAILLMRVGLGIVFFWFGVLKFFPGASPGEDLAGRTIGVLTLGLVPPQVSLRLLATAETLIGLGLISGIWLRTALLALLLQMLGTLTPLVLFPALTFAHAPYAPTLEGQYILKNIVLVTAAMVVGATVRGGRLVAHPVRFDDRTAPGSGAGLGPIRADGRALPPKAPVSGRRLIREPARRPSADGIVGRRGGGRQVTALVPQSRGWPMTARTARLRA